MLVFHFCFCICVLLGKDGVANEVCGTMRPPHPPNRVGLGTAEYTIVYSWSPAGPRLGPIPGFFAGGGLAV